MRNEIGWFWTKFSKLPNVNEGEDEHEDGKENNHGQHEADHGQVVRPAGLEGHGSVLGNQILIAHVLLVAALDVLGHLVWHQVALALRTQIKSASQK